MHPLFSIAVSTYERAGIGTEVIGHAIAHVGCITLHAGTVSNTVLWIAEVNAEAVFTMAIGEIYHHAVIIKIMVKTSRYIITVNGAVREFMRITVAVFIVIIF